MWGIPTRISPRGEAEDGAAVQDTECSELRTWLLAVKTGVVMTLAVCMAVEIYIFATWDRPDRQIAAILAAVGAIGGITVWLLPLRRIILSGWRNLFLGVWSAIDIVLIALLAHVEHGSTSPFTLLFFLTLVFSSLFYPRWLVVVVGTFNVIAFLAVGALDPGADAAYLAFFSVCLAAAAVMCAWQASIHQGRNGALMTASRTDPLTGTLNRRGFEERMAAELERARRDQGGFGLVLLDLDAFKEVNDQQGHAAGDELLVWVAKTIESAVRPSDATGRLGGDEFAVLLAESGPGEVDRMANRIRSVVRERVACSAGHACFPLDGRDAEEMLSAADANLYANKRSASIGRRDLAWASALADAADHGSGRHHSRETAEVAVAIAGQLGWDESERRQLRIAALLHDVDVDTVARIDGMDQIVPWIRHTGEFYDGSGEPSGLLGRDTPKASRIIAVAEAFDEQHAIGRSVIDALAEVRGNAGTLFDPDSVQALGRAIAAGDVGGPHAEADLEELSLFLRDL